MATAASLADGASRAPDHRLVQFARWIALLLPASLLAGALGSEKLGGLVPCEMCHWQRWPHYFALAVAALSFAARGQPAGHLMVALAAAAIAVSGAIGVYHAGVELGIFQGLTACTSTVQGTNPDELLKSILATPLVRCDQVQFSFLGISMAGWNAVLSLGGAAIIAALLFKAQRA
jgi:disulfide bond formation protein DsbB